jgi:hypothetical protein
MKGAVQMEPFSDDDYLHEEEPGAAAAPEAGLVTGPAPYDAADDEDFEED